MKKYFEDKSFLAGFIFGLFALFYLIISLQVPASDVVSVGAGFMPRVYAIVLLLSCILLMIQSARRVAKEDERAEKINSVAISRDGWIRIILTFALIIFYAATLKVLGFIIDSTILVFALCTLLTPGYKKPRYVTYLIFALILSIITDILFAKGLSLLLPQGLTPIL